MHHFYTTLLSDDVFFYDFFFIPAGPMFADRVTATIAAPAGL